MYFMFLGYSYINDPYMCLIYEAMEAITTSLMTTSAVAYSAQLGTTTTLATIQGIIGGAYYGVGMQNSKKSQKIWKKIWKNLRKSEKNIKEIW